MLPKCEQLSLLSNTLNKRSISTSFCFNVLSLCSEWLYRIISLCGLGAMNVICFRINRFAFKEFLYFWRESKKRLIHQLPICSNVLFPELDNIIYNPLTLKLYRLYLWMYLYWKLSRGLISLRLFLAFPLPSSKVYHRGSFEKGTIELIED